MISDDILSTEYLGQNKVVNSIQPLVSVCIITYNHAPFIEECLDSILKQQTDFPFEIIIGEDNSSDGTRQICMRYAEKHPDKIRLFLRRPDQKIEVNGKKTFHFNFFEGLKAARGEFIALCEGDDYWITSKKLQIQRDLLENDKGAVMVFSGWNDKIKSFDENRLKYKIHKKHGEFDNSIAHTSSIFFRSITKKFPQYFFEVKVGDRHLFAYILRFGYGINVSPALSFYRKHDGGVWTGISEEQKIKDRVYDLKILYKHGQIDKIYYLTRSFSIMFPEIESVLSVKFIKKQFRRFINKF